MDDRGRVPHAGQRRTDECLRRLQTVIGMIGASSRQIHECRRLTRPILQDSGRTNLPQLRAVMCPSAKIVSPRRSVRANDAAEGLSDVRAHLVPLLKIVRVAA